MKPSGILLDTGPLVALLSKDDGNHDRARRLFAECAPPFRSCEAVVAEACFLMRKVHAAGPADVVALGARGVYQVAIAAEEHWTNIEALLKKYRESADLSGGRLSHTHRGDLPGGENPDVRQRLQCLQVGAKQEVRRAVGR